MDTSKNLRWITFLLYMMSALTVATLWFTISSALSQSEATLTQSQVNERLIELLTVEQLQANERTERAVNSLVCILLMHPDDRTPELVGDCLEDPPPLE